LPAGALVPSAVEPNVVQVEPVRAALRAALGRLDARGESIALLIPDPAVRVFVLPFEKFPRRADEAVPLLRWRLKKSVPFDVEETVVSWMQQPAAKSGVEVLVALARTRILRQYEELVEAAGMMPGVVLGASLAALPLLEDDRPSLLVRLAGTTLTLVIVWGERVVMYRSTEVGAEPARLAPQVLLDEVFPALAYFHDAHHAEVQQIYLAGFGPRWAEFRDALAAEVPARVLTLLSSSAVPTEAAAEARALAERSLEALVGWMANRGA
jgi:type IV pilus assembly protein PilM